MIQVARGERAAIPFAGCTHTSLDAELESVVCDLAVVGIPYLAAILQAAVPILKFERWLAFPITVPCFGAGLACLRVEPGGFSVM